MRDVWLFFEVQVEVVEFLKGRIVVGYDVKYDFKCFDFDYLMKMIWDIVKFLGFKKYGNGFKFVLKVLVKEILGLEI